MGPADARRHALRDRLAHLRIEVFSYSFRFKSSLLRHERLLMRLISKRFLSTLVSVSLLPFAATGQQARTDASTPAQQTLEFPTVLYGAAYYNEYMPGDQDERLTTDIAMMKAAAPRPPPHEAKERSTQFQ